MSCFMMLDAWKFVIHPRDKKSPLEIPEIFNKSSYETMVFPSKYYSF